MVRLDTQTVVSLNSTSMFKSTLGLYTHAGGNKGVFVCEGAADKQIQWVTEKDHDTALSGHDLAPHARVLAMNDPGGAYALRSRLVLLPTANVFLPKRVE